MGPNLAKATLARRIQPAVVGLSQLRAAKNNVGMGGASNLAARQQQTGLGKRGEQEEEEVSAAKAPMGSLRYVS